MQDKIIISRLMVYCNHGVFEEDTCLASGGEAEEEPQRQHAAET